jgi:hypothetical protein
MTEVKLKYTLGMFIVLCHVVVVMYTLVLFTMHGFTFSQLTTLLAIIIPMLAGYTTSIVTFIIKDRHRLSIKSKPVTASFVVLSFLFPGVFILAIVVAVTLQAFNLSFDNFEDFKATLVLIEGAFAVYVGKFVASLFESGASRPPRKETGATLTDNA